ncbi:DUF7410 domain-containing protein [Salinilacihabitans rarus]|uniref:DUF7410 domain-containing protein n=1 Tax=Salinilacihabitans rarus TaxID=2961596 RepID=UPI0020C83951|nr:hypothetical protein [Salinilacihabitans rarus]
MSVDEAPAAEYDVPPGEEPAATCPYCGRPFREERYATFHVGAEHAAACSDAEREAFEDERDDEEYELFTFHLKAAVSVFFVYFVFTFVYALVWSG